MIIMSIMRMIVMRIMIILLIRIISNFFKKNENKKECEWE